MGCEGQAGQLTTVLAMPSCAVPTLACLIMLCLIVLCCPTPPPPHHQDARVRDEANRKVVNSIVQGSAAVRESLLVLVLAVAGLVGESY